MNIDESNETQNINKKKYNLIAFFRIVLYTVILVFIYSYSFKLFHKDLTPYSPYSNDLLAQIANSGVLTNKINATISLSILLISLITYYILFIREIDILKEHNRNFRFVLLFLFILIVTILTFSFRFDYYEYSFKQISYIYLNSQFLYFMRSAILYSPIFVLIVYSIRFILYLFKKLFTIKEKKTV